MTMKAGHDVQKDLFVSMADLRRVVMECQACKTQIVFDITLVPQNAPPVRGTATPAICPACDSSFDSAVQRAVDLFRQAYTTAAAHKPQLMFKIRIDDPNET